MVCGRGSGLEPSDWGGLLSGPGLSGVTELNGLAWSPDRRAAVQATLERVARRKATPHVHYRTSVVVWIVVGFLVLATAAAVLIPMLSRGV